MKLLNWIKVIDKKLAPLNVESNLCTKIISPNSTCNACSDHCPVNSITFKDKEIQIDDSCLECGLCSTVCPTGSLVFNRPSLNQFVQDVVHTCEQHEFVYLHCEKMSLSDRSVTGVSVPCLGMIPREAWVRLLNKSPNLSIYHSDVVCQSCEITTGEKVWRKELHEGETMSHLSIEITTNQKVSKETENFNVDRRAFLSTFFTEMKSTNKLAMKELIGESNIPNYQEKIQKDSFTKVKREWNHVSNQIVERITNESVYPYMRKRSLLLAELEENEALQHGNDIRLPQINSDCYHCGACVILCPTEALTMNNKDGHQTISLQPFKCIDCSLCEDICYIKSIQLQPAPNRTLLSNELVLTK